MDLIAPPVGVMHVCSLCTFALIDLRKAPVARRKQLEKVWKELSPYCNTTARRPWQKKRQHGGEGGGGTRALQWVTVIAFIVKKANMLCRGRYVRLFSSTLEKRLLLVASNSRRCGRSCRRTATLPLVARGKRSANRDATMPNKAPK